jgi:hypothetical protein
MKPPLDTSACYAFVAFSSDCQHKNCIMKIVSARKYFECRIKNCQQAKWKMLMKIFLKCQRTNLKRLFEKMSRYNFLRKQNRQCRLWQCHAYGHRESTREFFKILCRKRVIMVSMKRIKVKVFSLF